jgi:ketosteroid isomerase-like protein
MTEADAVLAANLEFYRAFTSRDAAAMENLWARRLPIACTHPGWEPLRDRESVIGSWRNILANPESPTVACQDEEVFLYGEIAIVICEEDLPGNTLTATNVFAREDGAWRLVHHQSGPVFQRRAEPRRKPPRRLN